MRAHDWGSAERDQYPSGCRNVNHGEAKVLITDREFSAVARGRRRHGRGPAFRQRHLPNFILGSTGPSGHQHPLATTRACRISSAFPPTAGGTAVSALCQNRAGFLCHGAEQAFWQSRCCWPDAEPMHAAADFSQMRVQRVPVIRGDLIEEVGVVITPDQPGHLAYAGDRASCAAAARPAERGGGLDRVVPDA